MSCTLASTAYGKATRPIPRVLAAKLIAADVQARNILSDGHAVMQVRTNVQYAMEGLGLSPSESAVAEQTASKEVAAILTPVLGQTWPSGKPENN